MSKYIVKWKSVFSGLEPEEDIKVVEFEDIFFRDAYVRGKDLKTGITYYIPYTSMYDMEYVED